MPFDDAETGGCAPPEIVCNESATSDAHPSHLSAILVLLLPLNLLQILFAGLALSILERHQPLTDRDAREPRMGEGDDIWTRPWADEGTAGYAVFSAIVSLAVFVGHAVSEAYVDSAAKRRRAFYFAGCAVGYFELYAVVLAIRDVWHFLSFGIGPHGDMDALWVGIWLSVVAVVVALSLFVVLGYIGLLKRIMRENSPEMQERAGTETEPLLGSNAMIHPGLSYNTHAEVR